MRFKKDVNVLPDAIQSAWAEAEQKAQEARAHLEQIKVEQEADSNAGWEKAIEFSEEHPELLTPECYYKHPEVRVSWNDAEWMGNFYGGGCGHEFTLDSHGWLETSSTYRGRWEENSPTRYANGKEPVWLSHFRNATGLKEPMDGLKVNTYRNRNGYWEFTLPVSGAVVKYYTPEAKQRRKEFHAEQKKQLMEELGFKSGTANRIIREAGPAMAVEAAKWAIGWIETDGDAKGQQPLVVAILGGLNRPKLSMSDARMHRVLDRAGAPQGTPDRYKDLDPFLRAAEEAAIGYHGRFADTKQEKEAL